MNPWLLLFIAILLEIIGTSALKVSDGFTRLGPALIVVVGYGLSFYCLSLVLRTLPMGITYAVWSGVGILLITLVGWLFMGQKLDAGAIVGILLIISGVIVMNLFSKSLPH